MIILSVRGVVVSPLKRCIQTAEFIYPNVDIEIYDKLKEWISAILRINHTRI